MQECRHAGGRNAAAISRAPVFKKPLAEATLFVGVALALPAAWFAGVLAAGGSASRALAFHPLGHAQLWQAVFTVTGWLHAPATTPGAVRLLLLGLLLLAGGAVLFWRRRTLLAPTWRAAFMRLLLLFVLYYLGFLALSISFLDANTPLDDRILAPVYDWPLSTIQLQAGTDGELVSLAPRRVSYAGVVHRGSLATAAVVQGIRSTAWATQPSVAEATQPMRPAHGCDISRTPEAINFYWPQALSLPRKTRRAWRRQRWPRGRYCRPAAGSETGADSLLMGKRTARRILPWKSGCRQWRIVCPTAPYTSPGPEVKEQRKRGLHAYDSLSSCLPTTVKPLPPL